MGTLGTIVTSDAEPPQPTLSSDCPSPTPTHASDTDEDAGGSSPATHTASDHVTQGHLYVDACPRLCFLVAEPVATFREGILLVPSTFSPRAYIHRAATWKLVSQNELFRIMWGLRPSTPEATCFSLGWSTFIEGNRVVEEMSPS
ncbi:hypothetical protein PIB30_059598 [Stylosanthes scabra]|uniref:Uncharacterized protein n=1 Tax=Stylosanthes scabra TaxID=79078 RepID=A0ABU6WNM7_9FABA|nr:hypothetical protein [Stylosanthes scabra]